MFVVLFIIVVLSIEKISRVLVYLFTNEYIYTHTHTYVRT